MLSLTTSTNCLCASTFCLQPGSWIWQHLPTVSVPAPSACYLEVGSDNTYKLSVCQLLLLATWKLELTTSTNSQCASYFWLLPGSWIWQHLPTISVPIYQLSVCQLLLLITWMLDLTTPTNCQYASYFCLLPGSWNWQHLPILSVPTTTATDNNCSDKNLTWWGRYC